MRLAGGTHKGKEQLLSWRVNTHGGRGRRRGATKALHTQHTMQTLDRQGVCEVVVVGSPSTNTNTIETHVQILSQQHTLPA